jgi:hypothetical protein
VLDSRGEPVPVGVRGELYIGGSGVRRGYWRRPALTAEKFLPDPFGPDVGGRLYRTGDCARWRVSGELEFLGRLDDQVKLRGQRIELGEIELALSAHPHVRDAVVLVRGTGTAQDLIGYVVADAQVPGVRELRDHLLRRLPGHMVPSVFSFLDRFPLLRSGKIDRAALPEPPSTRPDSAASYVPPADAVEHVLAEIWAELLELDQVGMADDFFELGGHSLLVTQAVYRIRELLRVDLPIPSFLSAATVADLATVLRGEAARSSVDVSRIAELTLQVSAMNQAQVIEQLSAAAQRSMA